MNTPLFTATLDGHFVVRDTQCKFNAVGADMGLKETINIFQKSCGGIVGQIRRKDYITKWQLCYHEIIAISNTLFAVLGITGVDYDLQQHHDLTGSVSEELECNIEHMLIYMESRSNPYSLIGEQRLHNFVSNAVVPEVKAQKLLNFRTIADPAYSSFQQDRLLDRLQAVSDTIPKQNLPAFMTIQVDV